jgi:hypothetical protein
MDIDYRVRPEPKWMKWIPLVSLAVSSTSLIFAVKILYPWHLELSAQFAEVLKRTQVL